jgi:hypothetical protein
MGMKARTIRAVLRKKVGNWLNTIDDDVVRQSAEKDVIVSGGAIASMLLGEKPNDYDLYFKTKETAKIVASYYVDRFNKIKNTNDIVEYNAEVKEQKVVNCKGEFEDRIVIYMKSAGVASENQEAYTYFESEPEHATEVFVDSIAKKFEENPVELVEEISERLKAEKTRYRPIFLTDNAITLSDKVQLIIRFYGDISEIHKNFDYVHATCTYDYDKNELVLPAEALEALLSKTLVYRGSLYPIASVFRIRKFIERGFRITAGQLIKIIWQINELDLNNVSLLNDQLLGVDVAYMRQLIDRIQDDNPKKIDSTYIMQLIDEVLE